jgi:hypothetical protein
LGTVELSYGIGHFDEGYEMNFIKRLRRNVKIMIKILQKRN